MKIKIEKVGDNLGLWYFKNDVNMRKYEGNDEHYWIGRGEKERREKVHRGKKQGTERGCCHQSSLGDTQITQNPSIHAGPPAWWQIYLPFLDLLIVKRENCLVLFLSHSLTLFFLFPFSLGLVVTLSVSIRLEPQGRKRSQYILVPIL